MKNLELFGGESEPAETKPRDGYKGIEARAINWYVTNNSCRLTISNYPTVTFVDRNSGEEIKENIKDLVDQYRSWKKEDLKERARQRRLEKQMADNGRGGAYGR